MFEAKLTEGHILKKIIEAIKDLVTDVNIDVSPSGKYQSTLGHMKTSSFRKIRFEISKIFGNSDLTNN